jgi:hypothetical protein
LINTLLLLTYGYDSQTLQSLDDVMILHLHIHKLEIFGDAPEFKMVKDSIEKLSNHFNLSVQHPDDKIDK